MEGVHFRLFRLDCCMYKKKFKKIKFLILSSKGAEGGGGQSLKVKFFYALP